jgi:hypothetical protein
MPSRLSEKEYVKVGRDRGIKWVGQLPKNTKGKTGWECQKGHRWKAPYRSIAQRHGCPVCGGTGKKWGIDYYRLGKKYGFFWIGPMVKNTRAKTRWKCKNGHVFEATYARLSMGIKECPTCRKKGA